MCKCKISRNISIVNIMGEIENTTEAAKNASELANNVYSDLRPIIQPIAKSIGRVIDFMGSTTLPFQYWADVAKINYAKRLEEYKKKIESVKDEDRCEVHPELGVPIMQSLPYTTNDDIAEMFTNLLASASISSMACSAHPAFVEYIKMMSPDEAIIVKYLKTNDVIPHVTYRVNWKNPRKGFITPIENEIGIEHKVNLVYPQNSKQYISNLLSLGIIEDSGSLYLINDKFYDEIIEYKQLKKVASQFENMEDVDSVTINKGYYHVTEIGKMFIKACCR